MAIKRGIKRKADQPIEIKETAEKPTQIRKRATTTRKPTQDFTDFSTLNLCFIRAVSIQLKHNPAANISYLFDQYNSHVNLEKKQTSFCIFNNNEKKDEIDKDVLFDNIFGKKK